MLSRNWSRERLLSLELHGGWGVGGIMTGPQTVTASFPRLDAEFKHLLSGLCGRSSSFTCGRDGNGVQTSRASFWVQTFELSLTSVDVKCPNYVQSFVSSDRRSPAAFGS